MLEIAQEAEEAEAERAAEKPTDLKQKKMKTEKRTIWFQGTAFVIEEEISSDSDEISKVDTSDDEFEVDKYKFLNEDILDDNQTVMDSQMK